MPNAHAHRQRVHPTAKHSADKCPYCAWAKLGYPKKLKPANMTGHRHNPMRKRSGRRKPTRVVQ